jgi:hypothetical protein
LVCSPNRRCVWTSVTRRCFMRPLRGDSESHLAKPHLTARGDFESFPPTMLRAGRTWAGTLVVVSADAVVDALIGSLRGCTGINCSTQP